MRGVLSFVLVLIGLCLSHPCLAQSGPTPPQPDCVHFNETVSPEPYSATNIIAVHNALLTTCDNPNFDQDIFSHKVKLLQAAGVKLLFTASGGLTLHQRAEILNDYGFWLFKAGEVSDAISTYKQVLRIDRKRAVAWLNLGDSYCSYYPCSEGPDGPTETMKTVNTTWDQRVKWTRLTLDAYQQYLKFSAAPLARVSSFVSLNILNAPSGNVCQFVAAFANAGRESEIYSNQTIDGVTEPVDLFGDGKKYYIYSGQAGSAGEQFIFASPTLVQPDSLQFSFYGKSPVSFAPLNFLSTRARFNLFEFENHYYVVDDEFSSNSETGFSPTRVVEPNKGVICNISRKYKPTLEPDLNHRVCDKFLHGGRFHKIEPGGVFISVYAPKNNITDNPDGPEGVTLSEVDLENNGKEQNVGYFEIDSGAGPGCDGSGFSLFDPVRKQVVDSPLNDEILGIQAKAADCLGAAAFLIAVDGKTYFEIDRGRSDPGETVGEGIYEVKNEDV